MVIIQQISEIKIKEDYVVIKIYYDLYEQLFLRLFGWFSSVCQFHFRS